MVAEHVTFGVCISLIASASFNFRWVLPWSSRLQASILSYWKHKEIDALKMFYIRIEIILGRVEDAAVHAWACAWPCIGVFRWEEGGGTKSKDRATINYDQGTKKTSRSAPRSYQSGSRDFVKTPTTTRSKISKIG